MLKAKNQKELMQAVGSNEYDLLIGSPPCPTFSRPPFLEAQLANVTDPTEGEVASVALQMGATSSSTSSCTSTSERLGKR